VSGDVRATSPHERPSAGSLCCKIAGIGFRLSGEQCSAILRLADTMSGAREGDMTMDSSNQVQSFDWQKLLFSFEGRTRRSHFWIGWLICLGAGVVAGWIPLIGFFISIALIWPNLAITVKRLHDLGISGWIAAVPFVANIVGFVMIFVTVGASVFMNATALENEDPAAILALIGPAIGILGLLLLVNFGFLLWVGLVDGKPGSNKYGPSPKG
jgi:uncharacterized membrane protein YhaH (DUF805 family)